MIPIKTPKEIEIMAEAGKKLAKVKNTVGQSIKPGVTLAWLDRIADGEIKKLGADPAFKRVRGYKWATCINVNSGVVHGIPTSYEVRPGDKVSIDVGIWYKSMNVDSAFTMAVPPILPTLSRFIEVGRRALKSAINEVRPGNRVGHISQAIEKVVRSADYSPVYIFSGHGVGRKLHEEPAIPCLLRERIEDTPLLKPGMVLAIEAIYTQGEPDVIIGEDGWTARTKDGKMGGLFEETVVITKKGPRVLTANGP